MDAKKLCEKDELMVQGMLCSIGGNVIAQWQAKCACGDEISCIGQSLEGMLRKMMIAHRRNNCNLDKKGGHCFILRNRDSKKRIGVLMGKIWIGEVDLVA